jgi:hypothetical protein
MSILLLFIRHPYRSSDQSCFEWKWGRVKAMTVRDNPVKRIILVRKISGKLAVGVQGYVEAPPALNLRPVAAPKALSINSARCRNVVSSPVITIKAA